MKWALGELQKAYGTKPRQDGCGLVGFYNRKTGYIDWFRLCLDYAPLPGYRMTGSTRYRKK